MCNSIHIGMKDSLHLKTFDNQVSGVGGLIFYASSLNLCLYFKLNMSKIKFIISPPFKSSTYPLLISSFLRMTPLVLQPIASGAQVFLTFPIFIIPSAVTSNRNSAKFLACIFFLSFFFFFTSTEVNHFLSLRHWQYTPA